MKEDDVDRQTRLRRAALKAGVTMIAPETVFLSENTTFGALERSPQRIRDGGAARYREKRKATKREKAA